MEAFSIYSPVLTSHFPHRWKDLCQYKLLLLRTYQQFVNRVWLAYDRAFREHAATTNLTDWSNINVQLFNFHAAGAFTRGHGEIADDPAEPAGARWTLKLFVNRGLGVAAMPLMPNVLFPIADLAAQGPIMLQPSSAWFLHHPGRL